MKEYDILVIGSGEGRSIVYNALRAGLKVALVDKGPTGGTCINLGCVPSKMLIYPIDRISEITAAKKLGIEATINRVDFKFLMDRMRTGIRQSRDFIARDLLESENLDFYQGTGHFVDDYTVETQGEQFKGKKVFIVSGSRPAIPPIKGLDSIEYLTNETVLELTEKPQSIIFVGGGYISVEYAHFFSAIGTEVTILEEGPRLVAHEEPEISELLKASLTRRMQVHTSMHVEELRKSAQGGIVRAKDKMSNGEKEFSAERVMIATGRKSNADLLKVENTHVKTDKRHYVDVDDYLQTSMPNIWSFGDAIGKQMFTHAGYKEAEIAWHNATHDEKTKMRFDIVPHAIYTYPEIAAIGFTEEEAGKSHDILVGKAMYSDVVAGDAIMEEEGFAKAIVDKKTKKILGFHIIGPHAAILIQEVVTIMANDLTADAITETMHIFPALSELIPEALHKVRAQ